MTHEQRIEKYGRMSNPPFNSKETYRAWVTAWKLNYATVAQQIRARRCADRLDQSLAGHCRNRLGTMWYAHDKRVQALEEERAKRPASIIKLAATAPQRSLRSLRIEANNLLVERHQSKIAAQEQYLASKTTVAA